jgi:catalase
LKSAIAFELSHCDDPLKKYIEILKNIDFDLAEFVAGKVNGNPPEQALQNRGKKSPALSQLYYLPKTPTIASRRVAILVADGFKMDEVRAFSKEKATMWIIGPRRAMIEADKESGLVADHHFEGQRSTFFDGLYIPRAIEIMCTANNDKSTEGKILKKEILTKNKRSTMETYMQVQSMWMEGVTKSANQPDSRTAGNSKSEIFWKLMSG